MSKTRYKGLLAIGDPHLASRVPGFRKDEYPQVILGKLDWCLEYAGEHQLLPALLGDVFHWPRDNANWLLGRVLEMLPPEVLTISGNHDCAENELGDDDSLSVLAKAGRLSLLDRTGPWRGTMGGRPVVIGGTSWGQDLPDSFDAPGAGSFPTLVFWLVHHDVFFPGNESTGRLKPYAIPGIHLVINGHVHRPLPEVVIGGTTWLNPGNIVRITRGDCTRDRTPTILRIDVDEHGWHKQAIEVPHRPFEEVFHEPVVSDPVIADDSAFVRGLAELVARRTQSGAGLREFLSQNLGQFEERVAAEIQNLANEVLQDEKEPIPIIPVRESRREAGHRAAQATLQFAARAKDPGRGEKE